MRALRPQYAYFLAHRQSNPVHPHGQEQKRNFSSFVSLSLLYTLYGEK